VAIFAGAVWALALVILLIASIFKRFSQYRGVRAVLDAIRPIVVGMILAAGTMLLFSAIGIGGVSDPIPDPVNVGIVAVLALIMWGYKRIRKKNLSVIGLILIAAAIGLIVGMLPSLWG